MRDQARAVKVHVDDPAEALGMTTEEFKELVFNIGLFEIINEAHRLIVCEACDAQTTAPRAVEARDLEPAARAVIAPYWTEG